jgi:hypothetical protein
VRRRAVLPLIIVAAGAIAGSGNADPPAETVLPAPAVVAVGHVPTPWMRNQLRRLSGSLKPARHPHALVIARLRLTIPSAPDHVWFVTYRARSGVLCGVMLNAAPGTRGLTTGGLPCAGQCGALCIAGTTSDGQNWQAFVATVPVAAETLRATVADGTTFRFPLTGPPVYGARDRRVAIGELPSAQPMTLVEALQGETVVGSQTLQP